MSEAEESRRGYWITADGVRVCVPTQPCATLTPGLTSPPGFSVHRIFQARILEWAILSLSQGSSPPSDAHGWGRR